MEKQKRIKVTGSKEAHELLYGKEYDLPTWKTAAGDIEGLKVRQLTFAQERSLNRFMADQGFIPPVQPSVSFMAVTSEQRLHLAYVFAHVIEHSDGDAEGFTAEDAMDLIVIGRDLELLQRAHAYVYNGSELEDCYGDEQRLRYLAKRWIERLDGSPAMNDRLQETLNALLDHLDSPDEDEDAVGEPEEPEEPAETSEK